MSNVNPVFAGKLTKKNMNDLPDGTIIMSNVCTTNMMSVLVHEVGNSTSRNESWQLIKERGANGRKAYGFSNWPSFRAYRDRMIKETTGYEERAVIGRKAGKTGVGVHLNGSHSFAVSINSFNRISSANATEMLKIFKSSITTVK